MPRRVPVALTLEARQYLEEARKVRASTVQVDESLKALGHETDTVGHDMDKMAAETAVAAKEVDKLGTQAKETAADMALLDRRIASAQRSVRNLGLEFALTGNKAAGERLGRQESFLAKLQGLRADVEHREGGAGGFSIDALIRDARKGGQDAGQAFGSGFSGMLDFGGSGIKPMHALIGGLIEFAVLAAPAIGAVISGAVAGAIGTVGVAGGVLSAIKDPTVKSAAKEFGDHISTEFFGSGSAFVDPIRESLGILQQDFDRLDIGKTLGKSAPYVTEIASGIGDLVDNSIPGLNKALDRMGPYADAAAIGFQQIGNGISDFFNDVTRSHGAVEGLKVFFSWLAGTISFLGAALRWLSERFHDMNKTAAFVVQQMGNVAEVLPFLDDQKLHDVAHALNKFADTDSPYAVQSADMLGDAFAGQADQAAKLTQKLNDLNQQTEDNVQSNLALWSANIDAAQAIADLDEKLIRGRKNWDLSTQAGRDNQKQLESTIAAIDAKREAAIKESDGSVDAINAINQEYDKQLEQILAIAKAAGDAKDALQKLEDTYYVKVIVDYQVLNQQNKGKSVDQSLFNLTGERAGGGAVAAGGTYLVGEHQPEILQLGPGQNGTVYPSVNGWKQAQQWNGGFGAAAAPSAGIDYAQLAAALSAVTVQAGPTYLDGHDVTAVVSGHQSADILARPRL